MGPRERPHFLPQAANGRSVISPSGGPAPPPEPPEAASPPEPEEPVGRYPRNPTKEKPDLCSTTFTSRAPAPTT